MVKIKLLDNEWLENTINDLLVSAENITDIEESVYNEKDYKELQQMINTIETLAAGSPTAAVLEEYKDALESRSGYEAIAAYLNGIKKGFNLAMFLNSSAASLKGKEN